MSQEISPKDVLKKYWGYDTFRYNQEEVIENILSNKDTLALMPTGAGKSLCYQIPALMKKGVCIVISPLVALMLDQQKSLEEKGISSKAIHSNLSRQEIETILNNCLLSKIKILYISPERVSSKLFLSYFEKMKISLIAVDEAHCISMWGYDFRPSFLKIANLRKYHPQVAILALSATAQRQVAKDIEEKLLFKKPNTIYSSFEKENISYNIFYEENKLERLVYIIKELRKDGVGIIYVRSRGNTIRIAHQLQSLGIKALAYNAAMSFPLRKLHQIKWQNDEVDCIVATTAFGMGIDKKDVRYVIHWDLPHSIEEYTQEVGRAGRDLKKAFGILLYNDNDIEQLRGNIEKMFPSKKYIQNMYNALCNYYQLAVGTGKDIRRDFPMLSFFHRYNFNAYEGYNAIKLLERSSLIEIIESDDVVSRIFFIANREEVFAFLEDYPQYYHLIEALRRNYAGIMTQFTIISEEKLARITYDEEKNVKKSLKMLEQYNILHYEPKTENAQIIFTFDRIPDSNFSLSEETYYNVKKTHKQKAEEMIDFIKSKECREKYILNYFNLPIENCNRCDICLKNNQKKNKKELKERIFNDIKLSPKKLNYFAYSINYNSTKEENIEIVRELLDEDKIFVKKSATDLYLSATDL
ncbi:MAG: RecQ family ATP-dependent DNA helicase [Bacteroidales bacterium]|jgi:ATP-dependent DNA helicase RecQ|nr:RecQ family ATP-dependent DNA helicase [Bacteroidales bacterium]